VLNQQSDYKLLKNEFAPWNSLDEIKDQMCRRHNPIGGDTFVKILYGRMKGRTQNYRAYLGVDGKIILNENKLHGL
jgi:hypothetical protein